MPKPKAEYYLKRCIDSGLWVADASTLESKDNEAEGAAEEEESEPVYQEVPAEAEKKAS